MNTNRRVVRAGIGVLALAGLALAGCGSDDESSSTTAAAAATTAVAPTTSAAATATTAAAGGSPAAGVGAITIAGFQFEIPDGLEAGETVTITNEDSAQHTFSDQAGAFSVAADPGEPSELTLPAAGTYTVVCKIHDGMTGTLTVS